MGLQVFLHHEVQGSLGQVLGNATPTVSIWDLCVLQVHDPLAHILIEQDSSVMTSRLLLQATYSLGYAPGPCRLLHGGRKQPNTRGVGVAGHQ